MLKRIWRFLSSLTSSIWRFLGPNDFVRTITSGFVIVFIGLSGIGLLLWFLSSGLPDLQKLRGYEPRLTTRILDRDDKLIFELYSQRRIMVPLDQIPQHTIDAILTIEDTRFYDHWGVDLIGITRAAVIDVLTLSLRQGASTVTQQLARDLYLHKRRTFGRKIQETLASIQIERNYSKNEILEMYLTQIPLGHGAYGIGSAAKLYFDKSARDLTLAESALLAALPKAPSHYSPYFHFDRSLARRNLVLKRMLVENVISQHQYAMAVAETLNVVPRSKETSLGIAPYFTETIRQNLSEEGKNRGFSYLTDGLTVQTTLDSSLQVFAEIAVDSHLTNMQPLYRKRFIKRSLTEICSTLYGPEEPPDIKRALSDSVIIDSIFSARSKLQVALVALDPHSGDILAMIGGRNFKESKFNRAVQAVRQPGSVFKPFAYMTAIDNGYSTTFELLNQDVVLTMPDGKRWVPQNYDHSHGGLTTLREGLRRSLNLVAARLVQEVVPPRMVVKYAKQMGITTRIAAVDAVALGASGVIPIEMVSAFSVFAAGGIYHTPRSILKINDRFGENIITYPIQRKVAISAETSYIMTDLLQTVINRGTGGSARWKYDFRAPAAGKTGTTNDFTDAWFIGFTPQLVCGVWVGLDDPQERLGAGYSGAAAALPIWAKFMKMAYDSLEFEDEKFEMPTGVVKVTICLDTKQIATPYCPNKVVEVFRQDSRPLTKCRKHRMR
ncbi:MAG: PBP1A family penicillin-binding protein [Candidatus Hatepunaea meridiana]|nr:PBP1A family penicillin-binding protein [Candidatus Hatepunaea meridiana]